MARNASDLVMLLGSRGKGRGRRGRSTLLGKLGHGLVRFLGGSSAAGKLGGSSRRGVLLPGWIVLVVALGCFAGGYFVGDRFGPTPADPGTGLKMGGGPVAPGLIEADTRPLASEAFFVAAYQDVPAAEARARAIRLSEYLQGQGLPKARPYLCPVPGGSLWCVTVYYSGAADKADTEERLKALPADVPCEIFVGLRNTESHWPQAFTIQ